MTSASDYASPAVRALRQDLALALRAAAHHGLSEGVCNHFSVMLPGAGDRYLINPRGLHWSEIGADDIVLIDVHGEVLAGRHRVEPTALFIHGAVHRITGHAVVLHCHMPYATALSMTDGRRMSSFNVSSTSPSIASIRPTMSFAQTVSPRFQCAVQP